MLSPALGLRVYSLSPYMDPCKECSPSTISGCCTKYSLTTAGPSGVSTFSTLRKALDTGERPESFLRKIRMSVVTCVPAFFSKAVPGSLTAATRSAFLPHSSRIEAPLTLSIVK